MAKNNVVFNGQKLEKYRIEKGLAQKEIANVLGVSCNSYANWVRRQYVAISRIEALRIIERTYNIDLEIETIPPMATYMAETYAKNKYAPTKKNMGLPTYPKQCRKCLWRRNAVCLTPLCLKRQKEYSVAIPWGSHLEIVRGNA